MDLVSHSNLRIGSGAAFQAAFALSASPAVLGRPLVDIGSSPCASAWQFPLRRPTSIDLEHEVLAEVFRACYTAELFVPAEIYRAALSSTCLPSTT